MGMPSISTTTIGTALTVIRENTISPVSCMILSIEALKTQIDGPTLLRARVEINLTITFPRFTECTSIDASSSASKSIHAVSRWDIVMRLHVTAGAQGVVSVTVRCAICRPKSFILGGRSASYSVPHDTSTTI